MSTHTFPESGTQNDTTGSFSFSYSSGTNQLIGAKDHASVQFNIGLIDENGAYTGEFKTVAFAGFLRSIGGSDQV